MHAALTFLRILREPSAYCYTAIDLGLHNALPHHIDPHALALLPMLRLVTALHESQ